MIFSNHSCDPNIGVQGQIVFVALREISIGEELTHDWATTDDDDYTPDLPLRGPSVPRRDYRERLAEDGSAAKISGDVLLVLAAED